MSDIEYHFSQLVNPNDIKNKMRKALLDVLDTQSSDFDPAQFRNLLNQSINRMQLPQLKLDIGDAGRDISRNFSGEVRGESDKARLQSQLRDALYQVFNRLSVEFNQAVLLITQELKATKDNLEATLTENINTELQQLKNDLNNQQQAVKDYQKLETILNHTTV